jgi:hypothetical protein
MHEHDTQYVMQRDRKPYAMRYKLQSSLSLSARSNRSREREKDYQTISVIKEQTRVNAFLHTTG